LQVKTPAKGNRLHNQVEISTNLVLLIENLTAKAPRLRHLCAFFKNSVLKTITAPSISSPFRPHYQSGTAFPLFLPKFIRDRTIPVMKIQPATLQFLSDLSANNHREWFQASKGRYKAAQENMQQFVKTVESALGETDHLEGATLFRIYRDVRFSKDKSPYKNNFGIGTIDGDELKGAPRGYDKDSPALDLIRKKSFTVQRSFTDQEVTSDQFLLEIRRTFEAMRPYFDYMSMVLTTNMNGEYLNH